MRNSTRPSISYEQKFWQNKIRIGYYHLCGADATLVHGTDFEDVYSRAWSRALATAYHFRIGVLFGTFQTDIA